MINYFSVIQYILVYFFLSRLLKSIAITLSGSYLLGSLFIEATILLLFIFYLVYAMRDRQHKIRFDWSKTLLMILLVCGIAQGFIFLARFNYGGIDPIIRSFACFRRYLFPLVLFFLFNYLLSNEMKKNGDQIFAKVHKLFKILLIVAVTYQLTEAVLRTSLAFNSFYTNFFIAPLMNAISGTKIIFNTFTTLAKTYPFFGFSPTFLRIFGIGLDYHVTGSIIFLCYMYVHLFSKKFKPLSLLNIFVFISLLFTGSAQFIIPFLIFYIVSLCIDVLNMNNKGWKLLTIAFFLILFIILPSFQPELFHPEAGIISYLIVLIPGIANNASLFIFGQGPVRTNLDITRTLIDKSGLTHLFLEKITDFGIFTLVLEIGILMAVLLFLFFLSVILYSPSRFKIANAAQKAYINKINIIIIFCMFTFTLHYQILFDRATYALFIFLLSLAYSYKTYRLKI